MSPNIGLNNKIVQIEPNELPKVTVQIVKQIPPHFLQQVDFPFLPVLDLIHMTHFAQQDIGKQQHFNHFRVKASQHFILLFIYMQSSGHHENMLR